MTPDRRRFTMLTSGAVVLVCIAVATPVYAFASRASHGVVVPKGSSASVAATCPQGEHVSFGGVVAQFVAPPHSGAIVLPEGARRTASGRWTVTGTSASNNTGSRLTAIAYCDRGAVPATVTSSKKVAGYQVGSATATCPVGTVVVGGGFNAGASSKNQEVLVQLAAPSARQWSVTVLNITAAATTLTSLAYCAHAVAPVVHTITVTLPAHKGETARVSCPRRTVIVFGGLLAHSPAAGKKAAAIAPFSWTAASTTQWVVSAYNGGDVSGRLDAFAYCR